MPRTRYSGSSRTGMLSAHGRETGVARVGPVFYVKRGLRVKRASARRRLSRTVRGVILAGGQGHPPGRTPAPEVLPPARNTIIHLKETRSWPQTRARPCCCPASALLSPLLLLTPHLAAPPPPVAVRAAVAGAAGAIAAAAGTVAVT